MKKITKFAALLLAVLMALTSFAGCNKAKTDEDTGDKYIYPATYFDLSDFGDNATVNQVTSVGEKAYMLVTMPTGETITNTYKDENGEDVEYSSDVYKNCLYELDLSTGEKKKLDGFVDLTSGYDTTTDDPAVRGYASINNMLETSDGKLAVVRTSETTTYNVPAGFNPETDNIWQYSSKTKLDVYIDVLDETGAVANTVTALSKEYSQDESYYGIRGVVCDKDGNWYINTTDGMEVYNADFSQKLFEETGDNNINNVVRTANGDIAAVLWDESGNFNVKTFDTAKKAFSEGKKLSMSTVYFNETFTGNSDYDFFGSDESGILGVNAKDGTVTRVLSWLDSDLSPDNIGHVAAMENGDFLVYNQNWETNSSELIRLVKTENDPSKEKKIITLATLNMDSEMRTLISDFNKNSSEYRIKVTDYSEYNTGDDYTAGITKLNTEIIAGRVPDIIAVGYFMPIDQYAAKGILEDLTPYIERDLGKDALVEDFFKTLRDDNGKLYEAYPAFTMQTLVGLRSVVGDEADWSFKKLQEAFATLPEGASIVGDYYSRSAALYMFLYSNMDKFVNWETGECSFDSQDFIDLLETVKTFPADEDINYDDGETAYVSDQVKVLTGKQLLSMANAYSLTDFRANTFYAYGKDDISFVGYPGTGAAFSAVGMGYAISAKSENKEAAWQFVSRILTEDYQNGQNKYGYYNGFPTNEAVFDKMMKAEATPTFGETVFSSTYVVGNNGTSSDGGLGEREPYYSGATNDKGVHEQPKTTYGFGGDFTVEVYAMTEQEKEVVLDLLKNTTAFMRYDTSLSDIINEEIQPFFKGEKSAADAAKMIQSRATIYVNEQK
mgnify:FL=1